MPTIKTAIVNKGAEDGNAPKQLYFEITNQGTEDVYVLKRNTPLEGLKTDCLEVKVNGEPVLYDGYFFKRASPKPQEYQLLQAGETLSVSFDLSQAYDTSLPGTYSVQFDLSNLVVMPAGAERESFTPESLQPADVTLENDGDSFAINEAQPGPTTIGAATRSDDKKKVGTRAFTEAATLQQPVVKGGSSAQQR